MKKSTGGSKISVAEETPKIDHLNFSERLGRALKTNTFLCPMIENQYLFLCSNSLDFR